MAQWEAVQVRANVGLLALGLGVGLFIGLTLAPRSGADVRRIVARFLHNAQTLWGLSGRLAEELAEDLSS
jgi:hypothetical protein